MPPLSNSTHTHSSSSAKTQNNEVCSQPNTPAQPQEKIPYQGPKPNEHLQGKILFAYYVKYQVSAHGWPLHDDRKQQLTKSHRQTALPKVLAMTWDELIPDHPTSTKGDMGTHFRLLLQLYGPLPPLSTAGTVGQTSPGTFGLLSLAASFLPVFSEKGWRTRECSSQLSFHDDSQILYGRPTDDDDDDERSRDGAEASAWGPARNKAPSDFLQREIHVLTVLRQIWVTRLHGKE